MIACPRLEVPGYKYGLCQGKSCPDRVPAHRSRRKHFFLSPCHAGCTGSSPELWRTRRRRSFLQTCVADQGPTQPPTWAGRAGAAHYIQGRRPPNRRQEACPGVATTSSTPTILITERSLLWASTGRVGGTIVSLQGRPIRDKSASHHALTISLLSPPPGLPSRSSSESPDRQRLPHTGRETRRENQLPAL